MVLTDKQRAIADSMAALKAHMDVLTAMVAAEADPQTQCAASAVYTATLTPKPVLTQADRNRADVELIHDAIMCVINSIDGAHVRVVTYAQERRIEITVLECTFNV